MAVVIASNLRKEIAGSVLFDGVSFKVERRDCVALAGPNGAGKTALLRMLARESEVHGGELAYQKGTRVALHDQRFLEYFIVTGGGRRSRGSVQAGCFARQAARGVQAGTPTDIPARRRRCG